MNIILLIIDTLRYDYIGANASAGSPPAHSPNSAIGDPVSTVRTPNLDRLASQSWVFERAFSSSFPTIPHRTDVMTGSHGQPFHPWAPLRFDAVALPRLLANAGYCTQLIHDTPHLVNGGHGFDWPFHAWSFVRGAEVDRPWIDDKAAQYPPNWGPDGIFDHLGELDKRVANDRTIVTYCRANRGRVGDEDWSVARLFRAGADFCRDNARRENFFLWLDCFDPHEPWDAPPQYVRMYDSTAGYDGRIDPRAFTGNNGQPWSQACARRLRAQYAAKVTHLDHQLGQLLDALEQTGLDRKTALIVTADHGTNVGERGRFGKQWVLHEQEAHVPLMIRVPGGGSGRCGWIMQPGDITATILALGQAEAPPGIDGQDALALAQGRASTGRGPRPLALAGPSTFEWTGAADQVLFSLFASDVYMHWAPALESCRLFRYGQLWPEEHASASMVEQLWQAGLAEVQRRGTPPDLLAWLKRHGTGRFPRECRVRPGPPGYSHYYEHLYNRW
jgi:arylsulfatase A-like enzyme